MTGPRDRSLTAIIALCAGVLAVAVGMIIVTVLGWLDSKPAPDLTVWPCSSESCDDPGQRYPAIWDATAMGNGQGRSFLLLERDAVPIYVCPGAQTTH